MGQSLSLAAQPGGSAGIDVPELSDVVYEKSLGTARLMKCVRARHRDGLVVIKLVMKPIATLELMKYVRAIRSERLRLADVTNALAYQHVFETPTNGYLVRQYFYSSLYDRLSTRPFLEDIEKKWLAYQLLCAIRDSHAREVYHGDIKTENILVTSWNWLYLTDYSASYKPTFLPEDNPADFSYYFDTAGRRTCYLAPERFIDSPESGNGRHVDWAMDIFSAGCVIAELFTEAPIFNLSQLFKYRKGEYEPTHGYLNKIQDEEVRGMVSQMISRQPESRYSAEECLNFFRRRAFPEYFYSFLHQYMGSITDPSSGRTAVHPQSTSFGEADDRIERLYNEFDKIAYSLGYGNESRQPESKQALSKTPEDMLPIQIDLPNKRHEATSLLHSQADDGSLIFLTLVESSLRHTARSSSRIRACDLMLAFAERVTDEAKLDRILPYLVYLLEDRIDGVRIAALRAMTQLLVMIRTVSPNNIYAFSEYIRPRLRHFTLIPGPKSGPVARATYASCLASLASSSLKIVDMMQALNMDGSIPTLDADTEDGISTPIAYQKSYDDTKAELLDSFELDTKALLTDTHTSVKRALLGSVSSLCVFFGSFRANDVVLSHLNTYLNDKDWLLKCAFLRTIVGVTISIGGPAFEEYVLPLMLQSLGDVEDFVIKEALSSFASMAELGLLQRSTSWELVEICARFMIHPNIWVKEAAVHFVAASTRFLSKAERYCIIAPLIQPYLKMPFADYSELNLLDALRKPLPRSVIEVAVSWASSWKKGRFWTKAPQQRTFSFAPSGLMLHTFSSKDLQPRTLLEYQRNEEDSQWLKKLRENGLTEEDDIKLLALHGYILHLASENRITAKTSNQSNMEKLLRLQQDLHVTPQTIFFEPGKGHIVPQRASYSRARSTSRSKKAETRSHTITDALLDASSSAAHSPSEDGRLHRNFRREGLGNKAKTDQLAKPKQPLSFKDMPSPKLKDPSQLALPTQQPPNTAAENIRHRHTADLDQFGSDGAITPTGSLKAASVSDRYPLRHKPSAMQLLNRKDTSKTVAEIGTVAATATGTVEGPTQGRSSPSVTKDELGDLTNRRTKLSRLDVGHSYTGKDPTVLRLLESVATDHYPIDIMDFGPQVAPVSQQHALRVADCRGDEQPWKPRGTLVAAFAEHTGAINRILPSPDHAFFITGSDDGTVKLWDTLRLERTLSHRARNTFVHSSQSQVKALAFIENTHTFASAATDGNIKVVKIDYDATGETSKYGRPRVLREYQLPNGEHAVWLDHTKTEIASLLLIATNCSRIMALDLRAMTELFVLHNPVHHGTLTCLCANHKQGWLVVGTSHGVLDLWDLRFQLRLKAWSLAGGKPIHRVMPSPFHPTDKKVCVAGGTGQADITIWDLEKGECREVFRVGGSKGSGKESVKPYEAWRVDEDRPEGMLGRFATAIDPSSEGDERHDVGMRALTFGVDKCDNTTPHALSGHILTGGVDRKVRCWGYPSASMSMVVSGMEAEEPQPKYSTSHPTTSLTVHAERSSHQAGEMNEGGSRAKRSSKQPRNTVISLQQQTLLNSHLDAITDVCLLESPLRMVVSADRTGCIRVFR